MAHRRNAYGSDCSKRDVDRQYRGVRAPNERASTASSELGFLSEHGLIQLQEAADPGAASYVCIELVA
jgi:hypothetical protein